MIYKCFGSYLFISYIINITMGWKTWSTWLKGAIIAEIIFLIAVWGFFTINYIKSGHVGYMGSSYSTLILVVGGSVALYGFIPALVIGAIIGLIVGKAKKHK